MSCDSQTTHLFDQVREKWMLNWPSKKLHYIVQSPGRVNLIGEHVDHQAYPVCPCAINQTICAAVSVEPKEDDLPLLQLEHLDSKIYQRYTFASAEELKVKDEKVWTNYVVAAYFGVAEYWLNGQCADKIGQAIDPSQGFTKDQIKKSRQIPESPLNFSIKLLFAGDVPPAAGLSSSGSVVVATTLAVAEVSKKRPSNRILADVCAKAERYTGVASGGMDQAAILLSIQDHATLIHFKPLTSEAVKLPKGGVLLIANTCRVAAKAQNAAKMYNKRVFELKAGCLALLPEDSARAITADELLDLQLRDVVRNYLKTTEKVLLADLSNRISEKVWTRKDILKIMGEERRDVLLNKRCGKGVWDQNEEFYVYQRVKHVLSESLRVEDFAQTTKSDTMSDEEKLVRLGELMNGSGDSLNENFDCSCPEIEQIVAIARREGAYGSRLTGAGWGGCTVSLVPESKQQKILDAIIKEYYEPRLAGKVKDALPLESLPPRERLSECIFITTPSQGAFVRQM